MKLTNQSTDSATATIRSSDGQEIAATIPAGGSTEVDLARYQGPFQAEMKLAGGQGGEVGNRDQFDTVIIRQDGSVVAESA